MLETLFSLFLIQPINPQNVMLPKGPTRYQAVTEAIRKIAENNPRTSRVFKLGDSDSGEPIWGLEISTELRVSAKISNEVSDLVVATHHGNEYGSTAVAVGMAENLAANPMRGHRVFVVPVLNISGYNQNNRYETARNRQLDPNRDYPSPCGTSGPFFLKSTKALADFVDKNNIVASATLHTYWNASLYPWGISTRDIKTEYDSTFIGLAKDSVVESGYTYGNSNELLYAADGTFEDYAFFKHGIWSLLFEMGDSHNPSPADIKKMIAGNVPGIRRFFENSPKTRAANHNFTGVCDRSVLKRVRLE